MRNWYQFKASAGSAELALIGAIGSVDDGVSAEKFIADLKTLPASVSALTVYVNSVGGSCFDAIAIGTALRDHRARVTAEVIGLAASAATIVTSAGCDSIRIAAEALMMIHDPSALAWGTAADHRKTAEALAQIKESIITAYQRHSSLSRERLSEMMAAETWLDAREAVAKGFATEVVPQASVAAAALLDASAVATLKVPARFQQRVAGFTKGAAPTIAGSWRDAHARARTGGIIRR